MNDTPSQQFLDALAELVAEQASRRAEGEALYGPDAPPIRPVWPLRFDLSGQ